MNTVVLTLLFPIIYTSIGAVIGVSWGVRMKPKEFAGQKIEEGELCISMEREYAQEIAQKAEVIRSYLLARNPDVLEDGFYKELYKKYEELEEVMARYKRYLEDNGEKIRLLQMENVCKSKKRREDFAAQFKALKNICDDIRNVNNAFKNYQRKYENCRKDPEMLLELYLGKKDSGDGFNHVINNLVALGTHCFKL